MVGADDALDHGEVVGSSLAVGQVAALEDGDLGGGWTPTGFVDTIRTGTMVYEERTGSGTGSQEVHPGI